MNPTSLTSTGLFSYLVSRITEESENKGIGFAADNVQITFDEEGNATVVERFYAPWQ